MLVDYPKSVRFSGFVSILIIVCKNVCSASASQTFIQPFFLIPWVLVWRALALERH